MLTSTPCKGSAGASVITSFLGGIADRFTMLVPMHFDNSIPGYVMDSQTAAQNISTWTPVNPTTYNGSGPNAASVSIGATTTAPDGTSTAHHLTEAALGGVSAQHWLSAGYRSQSTVNGGPRFRLAVFAKAAERTRCRLTIMDNGLSSGAAFCGCSTIFDLAGGQIGVANTSSNNFGGGHLSFIAGPASITAFPNGWYLCQMDATVPFGFNPGPQAFFGVFAEVFIDAGSGTGVEDTNYVGDGTSGIYIWNASLMPVQAWDSLSGQTVFFDDFTDPAMGNIDLNNTKAPGFNWYVGNSWPSYAFRAVDGVTPTAAAAFTQSGSTLTIASTSANSDNTQMQNAVTDGGSGYIANPGAVYTVPALVESKWFYTPGTGVAGGQQIPVWTMALEQLTSTPSTPPLNAIEIDFQETGGGFSPLFSGGNTHWWTPGISAAGESNVAFGPVDCAGGIPHWISTWIYDTTSNPYVYDPADGNYYQSIGGGGSGNVPHTTPGKWSLITFTTSSNRIASQSSINHFDLTQPHIYSFFWFPPTQTDYGQLLTFFDGVVVQPIIGFTTGVCQTLHGPNGFVGGIQFYTAIAPNEGAMHHSVMIGGPSTNPSHIDFVRITK